MSTKNEPEPQLLEGDTLEPSKSQLKRDAKAVLTLAGQLLNMRQSEILRLGLPENILAAIAEGRAITRFGARKRHTQYLAKMLRKEADIDNLQRVLDLPPGQVALPEKTDASHEQTLALLLSDQNTGFAKLREDYPGLERQRVTQLLRQIGAVADSAEPRRIKARKSLLALLQSHTNRN